MNVMKSTVGVVVAFFSVIACSRHVARGSRVAAHASGLWPPCDLHRIGAKHRGLQEAFPVELYLTLHFVNYTTAANLQSPDPSNEVLSHFCKSVNSQASGTQVRDAATAIGAIFETRQFNSSGTIDYQCTIDQTNYVYDSDAEDSFGRGFFILELAVQQVVHVTSLTPLTLSEVASIVIRGFNRGSGGRVRFRTLLQEHPAFHTISTVEVLPDSMLSPPQEAPSTLPSGIPTTSQAPTSQPSKAPSRQPSLFPDVSPSENPSSVIPSSAPSSIPSFDPTVQPSLGPTMEPSYDQTMQPSQLPSTDPSLEVTSMFPTHIPSISPSRSPVTLPGLSDPEREQSPSDDEEPDRLPLILGAIGGGIATILVSCFFIFCVWLPFCTKCSKKQPLQTNLQQGDATSGSTPLEGAMVSFSDESSLANTTMDEKNAGFFSTARKKKLNRREVGLLNSFDDSSLFTSTFNAEEGFGATYSLNASASHESSMILPPSLGQIADFEDDFIIPMDSDDEKIQEQEDLFFFSASQQTAGLSLLHPVGNAAKMRDTLEFSDDNESNPFIDKGSDQETDVDEEKNDLKIVGNATKGFDPFGHSGANDAVATYQESGSGNTSSQDQAGSHLTKNTLEAEKAGSHGKDSNISSEQRQKLQSELNEVRGQTPEKGVITKRRKNDDKGLSRRKASNNQLLRSVLEDAQVLAGTKAVTMSMSTSSKPSIKSAPPQAKSASEQIRSDEKRSGFSSPHTTKENHVNVLNSSKSVGSPPQPRTFRDLGEKAPKVPNRTSPPGGKPPTAGEERHGSQETAEKSSTPFRNPFLFDKTLPEDPHHFLPGETWDRPLKKVQKTPAAENSDESPLHGTKKNTEAGQLSAKLASLSSKAQNSKKQAHGKPKQAEHGKGNKEEQKVPSASRYPVGTLGAKSREKLNLWDIPSEDSVLYGTSDDSATTDTVAASTPDDSKTIEKRIGVLDDDNSETASDGLSNPWLFDSVEQTLGPRSVAADIESMSGRSSGSGRSYRSSASSKHTTTLRRPGGTSSTVEEEQKLELAGTPTNLAKRSLENDLKRLQRQLAGVIQHGDTDNMTVSSATTVGAGGSKGSSSRIAEAKKSKKRQVVVVVPPGKLGIVLKNRHDGKGTVVADVLPSSSMYGVLTPGDKLVAINGEDVTKLVVSEITSLMQSKISQQRKLTIVTSVPKTTTIFEGESKLGG
ncbi:hypothetical protein ACA910_005117 [Epithemia clementina (nom. ined.)]